MLHIYLLFFFFSESSNLPKNNSDNGEITLTPSNQQGSGNNKSTDLEENEDFISKVAHLVGQKLNHPLINARPVVNTWSNYERSFPNTAAVATPDTSAPLHFNNTIFKNDENDQFGMIKINLYKTLNDFFKE